MTTTTNRYRGIAFLLALWILAVPGPVSAERKGRLLGQVVDPDGKPIAGVKVTATSPDVADFDEVLTTDRKGVFIVDFRRLDVTYSYRFEKDGYRTTLANQKWSLEGTAKHRFTMAPAETPSAPRADASPPASRSNEAILAFNAGNAAFRDKDYAVAQARLEEALGHDAGLRQAWEVLSMVHLALEHYPQAVEAAERAIALGPTSEMPLRARWEAYEKLGNRERAAEAQQALKERGQLADVANRIYNEGVQLSRAGDSQGAFARFEEALAADPGHRLALLALATTGLKIGRAAESAAAAARLLEADPAHAEAARLRFNASLAVGDPAMIFDALAGLARVDPEAARPRMLKLARAAFESDDAAAARTRYGRILEIFPDDAFSHYQLGLLLMREGANQEAREHIRRFLELAPEDPDAGTAAEVLKHLGG